jgi:hypothetical protein
MGVEKPEAGDDKSVKSFSTDLTNMLASRTRPFKVDLYKIGPLANGASIYACNGSGPIAFNGNTYEPLKYGMWSRDTITNNIGLTSNATRLTVFADQRLPIAFPGLSNGCLLIDGIKFGFVSGAMVNIYTAYMTTYGVVVGPTGGSLVETKFSGVVTDVEDVGMTKATLNVQDLLYLLNLQVPRMIFQASCSNVLYDAKCTLSVDNFTRTSTVGALVSSLSFNPAFDLTRISAAGTFGQGVLTWTSGNNIGLSSYVQGWTNTHPQVITLDVAPVFPIQSGDGFKISEGCNKTFSSCLNLQPSVNPTSGLAMAYHNFAGQPYTPVPETAI